MGNVGHKTGTTRQRHSDPFRIFCEVVWDWCEENDIVCELSRSDGQVWNVALRAKDGLGWYRISTPVERIMVTETLVDFREKVTKRLSKLLHDARNARQRAFIEGDRGKNTNLQTS